MLKSVLALARLIIFDGLRRKALIGLFLFALAAIMSGLLFFHFIPQDIGRVSGDFLFSIVWITGLIFLFSHVVQLFSWDNERGSLHTYLARPISRAEYTLGLFTGMAILLLAIHLTLGVCNWLTLCLIQQWVPAEVFPVLSFTYFIVAGLGVYVLHLMLLAVILLFSSAVRGGFPALLCTLCYYLVCSGLPVVQEAMLETDPVSEKRLYALGLKKLSMMFPDFSWLDFKTLVVTSDPRPAPHQIITTFALIVVYIAVVLWGACFVYERRDLQ